jgi:hypothetical protein
MQGLRTIRVNRQRLLATELGVEVSFGLDMAKSGFMERRKTTATA